MALLVYFLTLSDDYSVKVATGVCHAPLREFQVGRLRVYVSDIDDVEACLGTAGAMKKSAVEFKEVQREVVAVITPVAFSFPTLLESEDAVAKLVGERESEYEAALRRLAGTVQYEIVASWGDQQTDTATPVSGADYRKRREQEMARVAAVDEKLKRVTGGMVREWRQRRDRKAHRWFGLIERGRREEFLTALRSAGPSEGVRVRLSGPWPPSEFVELADKPD